MAESLQSVTSVKFKIKNQNFAVPITFHFSAYFRPTQGSQWKRPSDEIVCWSCKHHTTCFSSSKSFKFLSAQKFSSLLIGFPRVCLGSLQPTLIWLFYFWIILLRRKVLWISLLKCEGCLAKISYFLDSSSLPAKEAFVDLCASNSSGLIELFIRINWLSIVHSPSDRLHNWPTRLNANLKIACVTCRLRFKREYYIILRVFRIRRHRLKSTGFRMRKEGSDFSSSFPILNFNTWFRLLKPPLSSASESTGALKLFL